MKSLRKRLAAALLLTMTLAWFAAFALQHRMVTDEQTGQWDQSLRDAAVQAMTLAPDSLLERAPGAGLAVATTPEEDADQTRVQVWSLADRRLLQRTPDTPDAPFVADFKPGYATSDSGGQTWRVYALNDASGRVQVQAAKSTQALRENYVHRLTRGLIFATLMFLLLVAAALGVMRRAFKPVDRAGDMILRRQPQDQTLVPLAGMPAELRPFIDSINQLLERQRATVEREREFLANAAHELRTPLAALSAQAELVARSPDTPQRAEAVDKLRAVAIRTGRLTEQLLDQARTDTLCDSVPETLRLDQLANMIARDYEAAAQRKQQRIVLDTQPCAVMGNLDALGVLLRNLLDNALRYTPAGGQVMVSCRDRQDGGAVLKVADNGPGIAPQERQRVFDRFHRVAGSGERGSGIGLALVAQIARRHGAEITLGAGLEDRGIALTVTFPSAAP
jgi:two-component system OmpR family sensor kinase